MKTRERIVSILTVILLVGVVWKPSVAADFTQLTTHPAGDRYPDWSHDGEKIAFDSERSGNREIWVMNADGTEEVNMTDNLALDTSPVWSPDGTRIAFASDRDGDQDIYIMDSDGGNVKRLAAFPGWDAMGDWSPDGTKIVWARGVFEIWVMDSDGSNQRRLAWGMRDVYCPTWSPDGEYIYFNSDKWRYGQGEIWRIRADGTEEPEQVTNDGNKHWRYVINPADPSKAAFDMDVGGLSYQKINPEIYLTNPCSGELVNITNHPAHDLFPDWSPDGTKIVFWSDRAGNFDVWVASDVALPTEDACRWETMPPMPTPRGNLSAAELDNVIYAVGGMTQYGRSAEDLPVVEAFDLEIGTWTEKAPMPTARSTAALVSCDGFLYAFGGRIGPSGNVRTVSVVERYDPSTDSWSTITPMPTARNGHRAVECGGKIYVMGGQQIGGQSLAIVEVYDPVTDSWTLAADMPAPSNAGVAAALNSNIYVLDYYSQRVFQYSPATDSWQACTPNCPVIGGWGGGAAIGGNIYMVGGYDPSKPTEFTAAAYEYNPRSNSFRRLADMPTVRGYLGGVAASDKLYAIGGFLDRVSWESTDAVECLDVQLLPQALEILATVGSGTFRLTWNCRPGNTYTIWSCFDLVIGPWVEEATILADGETTTWTDLDAACLCKFYKIEIK